MDLLVDNIKCPICEADNSRLFYDKEREDNEVCYVICQKCGLVYQNPRMKMEDFEKYYKELFRKTNLSESELDDYISSRIKVGENIYALITDELLKSRRARIKMRMLGSKSFSVLDIGCGVGGILIPFIKAGFTCKGIDTPSHYTKIGKEKLGVNIDEIFISDFRAEKKFDIIILNHALEHFLNPIEDLRKIRTLLKKNGLLYIEVPDVERPYSWTSLQYFFLLGHVFYYSPVTLDILLNKAGFRQILLDSESSPFMKSIFKKKDNFDYEILPEYYLGLIHKFQDIKREKEEQGGLTHPA